MTTKEQSSLYEDENIDNFTENEILGTDEGGNGLGNGTGIIEKVGSTDDLGENDLFEAALTESSTAAATGSVTTILTPGSAVLDLVDPSAASSATGTITPVVMPTPTTPTAAVGGVVKRSNSMTSNNSASASTTTAGIYGTINNMQYQGRRHFCYVGNMTWWTTDEDLAEAVKSLGLTDLLDIKFYENRANGQSKGFALVVFASDASVKIIMEKLSRVQIHGQQMIVMPYTKQAAAQLDAATKKPETSGKPPGPPGHHGGPPGPPGGLPPPGHPHPGHHGPPPHPGPGHHPHHLRPPGGAPPEKVNFMGTVRLGGGHGPPRHPPPPGMPPGMARHHRPPPPPGHPAHMIHHPRGPPPPRGHSQPPPGGVPTVVLQPGAPPRVLGAPPGVPQQHRLPPPGAVPRHPPPGSGLVPHHPPPGAPPPTGTPPVNRPPPSLGQPPPPSLGQPPPTVPPTSLASGMRHHAPPPSGPPPGAHINPNVYPGLAPGAPPGGPQIVHGGAHGHAGGAQPPLSDAEFEEIMNRNRTVSSSAISRAVSDAAAGDFASAIETLVTAISLIRQSKVANDARCKVLITSLQDTLHGIESKSYNRRGKDRPRDRSRSPPTRKRHRRSRSRSRSRDRYDYSPRHGGSSGGSRRY